MTQDKKFKFHKLTPRIVDTAHPSYIAPKRALDEAYMDKEIKNIAITGIYGSGKSSFLKTYFESDNDNDKLIKVAIADFKEPVKVNKDEIKDKIKVAERQIINQILYQIPSSSIPLSKFKIKEKRKWWRLLFTTLCLMAFIIGIFSLFNSSLIEFFYSDFLQVKEPSKWINITIMLCLMIPLLVTSVWLSKRASFKLTRFNFKGAETEITEDENLDLLDHEAREIVYLILASGVETIIFEDLDRFEDISLFIRLREINSLVNYKSKETVRFIYVIRDGLFESKDRTKFFDLIIPVIPTITSYNSKGKLVDMFSDIENENLKLPPKLLAQISVYIDDMRMLYSIRNEYEIYSKSIDVDVFAEELFALVVLKNVFPKEFEDLENDSGYLYEILNKRDILIVEYEELLNNKIDEREELKQLLLTRVSDFLAVNIPPSYDLRTSQSIGSYMNSWYLNQEDSRYIYSGYGGQSYTFETFIEELCKKDSSLKERLNQVNNEDFKYKIDSLDKEISRIREEISRRHTAKTKNLLAELSEEELANFFEEDNESYKDIIENHYYPLIRYLMLAGLVDENYWMYKGHFHEGYIGKNDNIFVNRLLTSKSIKNDFKLDNPEMVDSLLMDNDYYRKDIVNYDLMRMLIHKKKREKTICVLNVIESTKDEEAIEHINQYDYKELRLLVDLLTESCFEDFYQFFQAGILTSNLRLKLAGLACENLVLKPNPEFKDYISNNSKILELNFFESKEAILNGLESMEIQLVDISELEVSIELAFIIIENRLFIVNLDNVLNLIYLTSEEEDISKEKILEKLFAYLDNTKLVKLKEYVYEHLEFLLDKYILKIKEIEKFSSSGEEVLIEILNANLDTRIKIDFIGIENTIVKNISRVDEDELLPSLFNRNLVLYSKENIENYHERMGEVKTIIDFVNENYKKEFPFEQEIYENILNCTDTEFSLFKLISKDLGIQLDQISHWY